MRHLSGGRSFFMGHEIENEKEKKEDWHFISYTVGFLAYLSLLVS
jgi:hypothetical protein